jgi:small subunit ribosomal protein S16
LLTIRLTRMGSKKKPAYRIVVIEKAAARDGRYLEVLGHYNPKPATPLLQMNKDRYQYWVDKGAQPSATVRSFVSKI